MSPLQNPKYLRFSIRLNAVLASLNFFAAIIPPLSAMSYVNLGIGMLCLWQCLDRRNRLKALENGNDADSAN